MVTVASDNPYPSILMVETADPSTPAAGTQRLFCDTDGILKLIDDAAVVTEISSVVSAAAHIADATDAHDAAAISFDDTGLSITAADVQTALEELDAAAADLSGQELDYAADTTVNSITATTEATATAVVTGGAVAYDGSTVVLIEFYSSEVQCPGASGATISLWLYDGSSSIGRLARSINESSTGTNAAPVYAARRLTPSAATHTYSVRASVSTGTGVVRNGAGGNGAVMPGFIRITRV